MLKKIIFSLFGLLFLINQSAFTQSVEDSLLQQIQVAKTVDQRTGAMLELAELYSTKDLKYSNRLYKQVLESTLAEKINSKHLGIAYSKIAVNFTRLALRDSADYYIALATKFFQANQKDGDLAVVYWLCLSTKLKLENKLSECIQPALEAAQFQQNKHQRKWAAHALLSLGSAFSVIGDYNNALAYDMQSLELFKKEGDDLGTSYALFQIATQLHQEKEFGAAEKYYVQAIAIQKKLPSIKGLANSLGFLASLYRQSGKLNQSLATIDSALLFSGKLGQTGMHISNLDSKASTLREMGYLAESGKFLDTALNLAYKVNNVNQIASLKASLATWFLKNGNIPSALATAEDAVVTARSSKSFDTNLRALEVAANINSEAQDFRKAYSYSQLLSSLKDSAKNARSMERLRMLDVQQELTQKQKEVERLSADQQIQQAELKQQRLVQGCIVLLLLLTVAGAWIILSRQKAMARLKQNLAVEKIRSRIAQDLHDDLGSSLSSIKILSQVGIEGNQAYTSLEKIKERSNGLLESLSDMVWNINAPNDSVDQLISRMREYASEMLEGKGIRFEFDSGIRKDGRLSMEQRKNIYLMFKETIHNIIKHSQANSVKILIELQEKLRLVVQDDGVGIVTEVKGGNGLANLHKRAKEINGALKITSGPNEGTRIDFECSPHINM